MHRKRKWPGAAFALAVVACLPLGCPPTEEPKEKSAAVSDINPATARPGSMVKVTAAAAVFGAGQDTMVEMGGQPAAIQETISDTEANVIVPTLAPGTVDVALVESGKDPGDAVQFRIAKAISRRLVLNFQNNQVALVESAPVAGSFTEGVKPIGRRMSYDVFNEVGDLVWTGVVDHPTLGRTEFYDEPVPGQFVLRGAEPGTTANFAVKIPNIEGAAKVQFYDAAEGIDLKTDAGRAGRAFLNEIQVGG